MTYDEFVREMDDMQLDFSRDQIDECMRLFVSTATIALARGEDVRIPGLGVFKVAERAPRKCINPQTGKKMSVPAKRVPTFSAAKALKDAVA